MTTKPESALIVIPRAKGVCISAGMPPCFIISKNFLAAAPAITGVASRNEKRAAATRSKLRNKPAVMVMPLRGDAGHHRQGLAVPMTSESAKVTAAQVLLARSDPLAGPHHAADDDHHRPDHKRAAQRALGLLLEQKSDDTSRDGADDEQPQQPRILAQHLVVAESNAEPVRDDLQPGAEEIG